MTQTEQWIMCLALVYALPSFFAGIGLTLLWVRWRDHRATAKAADSLAPADQGGDFLADQFRLLPLFDSERLAGL